MVYACCVPSCNNNGKVRGVSLHSFTKDPALGKLWIDRINLDTQMSKLDLRPLTVSKYTKICSAHFKKSDYSVGSGLNRLNPDAIPSLFPWTSRRIFRQAKQKEFLIDSLDELQQLTELEQKLGGYDTRSKRSSGTGSQLNTNTPSASQESPSQEIVPKTEPFDAREKYSDGSEMEASSAPQENCFEPAAVIKTENFDDISEKYPDVGDLGAPSAPQEKLPEDVSVKIEGFNDGSVKIEGFDDVERYTDDASESSAPSVPQLNFFEEVLAKAADLAKAAEEFDARAKYSELGASSVPQENFSGDVSD